MELDGFMRRFRSKIVKCILSYQWNLCELLRDFYLLVLPYFNGCTDLIARVKVLGVHSS
jgi:hypothetical protein